MTRKTSWDGALAWMASNPVAANIIMIVLIVGGLVTAGPRQTGGHARV